MKVEVKKEEEEEEDCQTREVEGKVAAVPGTSAGAGTSSDQAAPNVAREGPERWRGEPSAAQGEPTRWPTRPEGELETDREKMQRKRFRDEKETPVGDVPAGPP